MYTRLYQQCKGTTRARSSVTKFMPPKSCGYYIIKTQSAKNIIPGATINIQYNFSCIDFENLHQDFKEVVENESAGGIGKLPPTIKKTTPIVELDLVQPTPIEQIINIVEDNISDENIVEDNIVDVSVESGVSPDANMFSPLNWGPKAWGFFEAVAFKYPENPTDDEKRAAGHFFESLKYLLPCEKCKVHFSENILKLPINVTSRDTLSRWVVDFHNLVNVSTNKPIKSYEEVAELYPAEACASCSLDNL